MRFSASSRYFAQRRARATPSSKTFSEVSSGSSPASSWSTICSSRPRASSNLMSLIPFPDLGDAGAQGALVKENLERIANGDLRGATHHFARGQARHPVAAREDGEGREAFEAPDRFREARTRRLDLMRRRRRQTAAELREQRTRTGHRGQRVAGAESVGGQRQAMARLALVGAQPQT